jgi:poly(3-hydroxybutyrate) depolymerase
MRKIFIPGFLGVFLFAAAASAAGGPQFYARHLKINISQEYVLQTPEGYDPGKKYPLLIAVHGSEGSAREQAQAWGDLASGNYILLCPQFEGDYKLMNRREDVRLMQILLELRQNFPYEENHVYLAGYSEGGEFASRFAFKRPTIIQGTALFAVREFGQPVNLLRNRAVKFFVGVGEKDDNRLDNRLRAATRFYQQMRRLQYDILLKVYPQAGRELNDDMKTDAVNFFGSLLQSGTGEDQE